MVMEEIHGNPKREISLKVGTENRTKLWVMLGLLLVAVISISRWISGSSSSAANVGAPSTPTPSQRTSTRPSHILVKPRNPASKHPSVLITSLDPTLRLDLLKSSESRDYTGGRRNIFEAQREQIRIPQPIANPIKAPIVTGPPPPPPPPPINLKFYGFASKPGESKQIFLSSGDDVFLGREGEIVNRRYRIVHIGNNSVEIEDVLNNNRQTIPLTQG